jgi:hypothetical protein
MNAFGIGGFKEGMPSAWRRNLAMGARAQGRKENKWGCLRHWREQRMNAFGIEGR